MLCVVVKGVAAGRLAIGGEGEKGVTPDHLASGEGGIIPLVEIFSRRSR